MESLSKKPKKGILKNSSSFEHSETRRRSSLEPIKWDEMNILQTLHPPDKDYGFMKIEEPKTPYSYYKEDTVDGETHSREETDHPQGATIDLEKLSEKILESPCPKALGASESSADDEDEGELTEEEKKRRREFELKRKRHYNEYQAVALARKLLEEEME